MNGTVTIGGVYSNFDITEPFYFRELALYAKGVYEDGRETDRGALFLRNAGSHRLTSCRPIRQKRP